MASCRLLSPGVYRGVHVTRLPAASALYQAPGLKKTAKDKSQTSRQLFPVSC